MAKKIINGLKQVHENYEAFFIDLWGVVHNGIKLHPEAIEVLHNLYKLKKRFVLMSNAPRPSNNVKKFLLNLKMDKIFLNNIFTSGEAALQSLKKNIYGKKFYHIGPKRDYDLIQGFEKNKTDINNCDFILCTGLFDQKENSLKYYENLLEKKLELKMVCTNPDLMVHRGSKTEYCAGSVAAVFEKMGGKVIYFGKPFPEIYNFCKKKNETVLAIGDNIRTDIKGANKMKFDSLFIFGGIHKDEFSNLSVENYEKIFDKYKAKANFYQKKLSW